MTDLRLQHCRLDGRYDILECLGRGSYAEIYKAHDNAAAEGAPETVVIKALNLLLQDEPDVELERTLVANFQNEAVALDRVRHSNIISRLGHGTALDLDGTQFHYIVLEYLPGGDMAALSRNRPLGISRALFYLEQVCSGLAYAHQCGVIHRDIKPQNLLLTEDKETVKIADFGVARLQSIEGAITRVGTNIYSAPEHNPLMHTAQLDPAAPIGERRQLTPAADIYSLAKTTYTLLAGEAPRRFAQHAIAELPPSLSDKYWSKPVARVLERATLNRPSERYQTVQEFWEELADAALPDTMELPGLLSADRIPRVSAELSLETEQTTQGPPRPHFELPQVGSAYAEAAAIRPRIVVPVATIMPLRPAIEIGASHAAARRIATGVRNEPASLSGAKIVNGRPRIRSASPPGRSAASGGKRILVAAMLVVAFSGMLLATHRYVTSHWNPFVDLPALANTFIVGREGVTTTDLNLRPDPSTEREPVGLAENGSRIRVLAVNDNWYEVRVLQHGRPKADQYTLDQGWVNKKYLKLD